MGEGGVSRLFASKICIMWRKKPRYWNTERESVRWRLDHRYNYVIENPLDGALWDLPCIKRLLKRSVKDEPYGLIAKLISTSYCHYNSNSQKRTGFLTTLNDTQLSLPCPCHPCDRVAVDDGFRHTPWESLGTKERNSIPMALIGHFLQAWVAKVPVDKAMILIDVFAGFGSVRSAVEAWNEVEDRKILLYDNDILRSRGALYDFDMGQFDLTFLENLILKGDKLQTKDTVILFWLSTPCTTYSIAGLHKHRPKGCAPSELAITHDRMNTKLFAELHSLCHVEGVDVTQSTR